MNKPLCVNCNIFYRIYKTGAYLIEMFNTPPRPYKIWQADAWKCPGCDSIIFKGYGQSEMFSKVGEHYQKNFDSILEKIRSNPDNLVAEGYERLSDVPK